MRRILDFVYLGMALAMLVYAVPQLQVGQGFTLPTVFTVVWLALALTVIAAHLHGILRVNGVVKEAAPEAKRVRQRS